jgi:5-methylcytosine-specific restriction endonuclease McrBC GTP-binding regulatory subunit McrB
MREDEIKKGVQLICDTSKEMSKLYEDKNALIDKLNSLHKEDLSPLECDYRSRSGPIIDLRKDVLIYMLDGNKLDEKIFDEFILKHRTGQEDKYVSYQNPFSIFHPFITSYGHESLREFVEQFVAEIIERLQLKGKVSYRYVAFQGAKYSGTDRLWFAISNNKHNSQNEVIQIFVKFQDGRIRYSIRRYDGKGIDIRGPVEKDSTTFDFEAFISFFEENKKLILKDEPEEEGSNVPFSYENFGVEFVSDNTKPPEMYVNLPKCSCNVILYGPPGTGKTYKTIDRAVKIITGNSASHEENKKVFDALREEGQIEFVTFHQNYGYEDFMIGIRPDLNEASTLKFRRKEGVFYKICKRAEQNYLQSQDQVEVPLKRYVLIIDEINRANISKVFGELITLLEEDKRIGAKNELRVSIPGEKAYFGIPPNVYVIGTMNTADKSIAMIDIALRRRFEFQGYFPDYSKVDELSGDILRHINNEIYNRKKSADYLIGHGYFMNGDEPPETSKVLQNKVIPLLMEYFSGKTEVVEEIFKESKWSVRYDRDKYCWEIEQ